MLIVDWVTMIIIIWGTNDCVGYMYVLSYVSICGCCI